MQDMFVIVFRELGHSFPDSLGGSASELQLYPILDQTNPKITTSKYIQSPQSYNIKLQVLLQTSRSDNASGLFSSYFPLYGSLYLHIMYTQIKKFDKSNSPITKRNISKGFSQSLLNSIKAIIQQANQGKIVTIKLAIVH